MKKLLLLLFMLVSTSCGILLFMVAMTSCGGAPNEGEVSTSSRVKTIQHDGHLFVLFKGYESVALIHHPGCECLE